MSGMLLSCANMPVIKQIADLLGIVMNAIYFVFDKMGIANIGLCIIVFTVIVRLLMIPMSIKQQKSMKLTSLINPEIQAIQKKYRGRRDNESMMAMNAETKAVYEKYGTSPSGGCLPMLIQLPIMLALYGVISAIPSHVGAVEDMYLEATDYIYKSMDEYSDLKTLNQIMVDNGIEGFEKQEEYTNIIETYYKADKENLDENKSTISNMFIDMYARQKYANKLDINKDCWYDMKVLKETSVEIAEALKNVSAEDWNKILELNKDDNKDNDISSFALGKVETYKEKQSAYYDEMIADINTNYENMDKVHDKAIDVYEFAGIDLSSSPAQAMEDGIWWAILIPILSAVFQWLTAHISSKTNQAQMQDNPMASSMKAMNIFMPLMSAFFCYSFAAGLGLYWVIGSVIQIIQTIVLNNHFKKLTVDDIIKSNIAKLNKKRAKKGLPPQKITTAANTNVKNIKVNTNNNNSNNDRKPNTSAGVTYKKGGIAAKANMVKEYNDKNK